MAWFRTNRGIAAWLAFFALACQLSLSFGHVHVGNSVANNWVVNNWVIGNSDAGSTTKLDAIGVDATEVGVTNVDVTNVDVTNGAAVPAAPRDPVGTAGDLCAICSNISLVGALILPILALVLAPASITRVLRWPVVAATSTSLYHRSFRARGPPHV